MCAMLQQFAKAARIFEEVNMPGWLTHMCLRATIVYGYQFQWILKIVDLMGINFSNFLQLLFLY